jgi:hypothetical protein
MLPPDPFSQQIRSDSKKQEAKLDGPMLAHLPTPRQQAQRPSCAPRPQSQPAGPGQGHLKIALINAMGRSKSTSVSDCVRMQRSENRRGNSMCREESLTEQRPAP